MTAAILIPALLFVAGLLLALPFFRTPPDDHFANYASWALFREPGASLPAHFTRLNQGGFSRMFLYPLAVFVHDRLGRDRLLPGLRAIAACVNAATGSLMYGVAVQLLGLAALPAAAGALLYLLVSTRPQFELLKYNTEVYQTAGEVVGVWLLLLLWPEAGESWWRLALPLGWLVFVSLHCKILFGANAAAIALGAWLLSGFSPTLAAVIAASGLVALGLFFLCVRNASPAHLLALRRYLGIFARQQVWANFKWNYTHLFYKTPLLAYAALWAVSLPLTAGRPFFPVFALWGLSALAVVVIQKRFCTYFFLIAFAPMAFSIMGGLDRLLAAQPLLLAAALGAFAWLGRVSLRELPGYYRKMPPRALVRRIHGSMDWLSSHDFRVEDVVAHQGAHPGRFLVWQTNLLAHYLTGVPPVVLAGTMIYDSQVMFPGRQAMLIAAAQRERPGWLYDFGGAHQGLLQFNPVSFLLASGLAYLPRERRHNILYYELAKTLAPAWSRRLETVRLYVLGSVARDSLGDQFLQAGVAPALPAGYDRDIADVCRGLLAGEGMAPAGAAIPDALAAAPGVAGLYAAALHIGGGDPARALAALEAWEQAAADVLAVFPALGLAYFVLQRLAGRPEEACRWPQAGFLGRTSLHEGLRQLELARETLRRGRLSAAGAARLAAIVAAAPRETDIHRYYWANEYNALLETFNASPA